VIAAVQGSDEPQRHVDAGRHALAGDQAPVDDVAGIADHGDVPAFLQRVFESDVGGDPAAAGGTGLVQEQGTGADTGSPGGGRGDGADPAGDRRVGYLAAGAHATRHQQHVQCRMVAEGVVGQHAQALGAPDRVAAFGDEHRRVGVVAQHAGDAEHLPRPDEVQLFRAIEDQQSVRCHVSSLVDRNRVR